MAWIVPTSATRAPAPASTPAPQPQGWSLGRVLTDIGHAGRSVAQAIPRSAVELGLSLQPTSSAKMPSTRTIAPNNLSLSLGPKPQNIPTKTAPNRVVPSSPFTRGLLGDAPVTSIQEQTKQTANSHKGGFHIKGTPITLTPKELAAVYAPAKTALDVSTVAGVGGVVKGGTKLANAITKARLNPSAPKSALTNLVEQVNKAQKETAAAKSVKPASVETPTVGKNVEPVVKAETPNPITAVKGMAKSNFSTSTTKQLKSLGASDVLHQTHDFKQMEVNAKKLVETDPNKAHDMFINGELSKSNPDAHIKLGDALLNDAVKRVKDNADYKANVQPLLNEYTAAQTRAGQALGATRKEFSPETMTRVAIKKADLEGRNLSADEIKTIRDLSSKISSMPEGAQKAQYVEALKKVIDQPSMWDKTMTIGKNIMSLPRALMASTDISFIGRQGAVLGARHPVQAIKAFKKGVGYFISSGKYKAGMEKIANITDKNGKELMPTLKRMGVDLEGVKGKSEEVFGTAQLAERLPVLGRIVAASDRSFTGTAAELRANVMKQIIDKYGGVEAINKTWTTKDMKDMGRVINTMTGRGHGKEGGWFEKAAPALGQTLFSARLWKSRLDMLNPVFYARLAPAARKEALQSAGAFATVVAATLAAAKAAGADVETNPTSSDFGKIKVGDTRIDIMGGLQQNIVLAARQIAGQTKSSTTGAVTKLNNKYGGPTRLSTALGFIQNKETPALGTTSRILGANPGGAQVTNPWGEIAKLFIPLGPSDIVQATKSGGAKGALLGLTTEIGTGVQTYSAQQTTNWNKNPGKELTQFKQSVGQQKFNQANKDYNNAVNQWYKNNLNTTKFKAIPDDQKNAYITGVKAKLKKQVFSNYGFTYHK